MRERNDKGANQTQAEKKEARKDCKKVLAYIGEMYENIDNESTKAENNGTDYADVIFQATLEKLSNALGQKGDPVAIADSPLVDNVCEILGQESVISHQITVRLGEEGSIGWNRRLK